MNNLFANIYKGKRVLVTGYTGFKGSWLCLWLKELGAEIAGYALQPPTNPNHFDLLHLDIFSIIGDIRDSEKLAKAIKAYQPEIVFHLAAQSLVRSSYKNPVETFETNIMGTINVFEACRNVDFVKAIVNITSDKCYENKEWVWGYRENDPMGGYDPYSASKGCAELITNTYRNSFFNPLNFQSSNSFTSPVLLASARAGNVIGGGDWAEDRLIPDIMRAISKNERVIIRNPKATRPWQHVLEPLSGYLMLGQALLEGKKGFAEGWNFGPNDEGSISVQEVVEHIKEIWGKVNYEIQTNTDKPYEANFLKLDCSKVRIKLKWRNVWDAQETFTKTVEWYKNYYTNKTVSSIDDLKSYIQKAKEKNIEWTI
jgi:CDP-glucose 4,6-dehydratase